MENLALKLALLRKFLDAAPQKVFDFGTSLDLLELAEKSGFKSEVENLKKKYASEAETNPQTAGWTEAKKLEAVVRAAARDFFCDLDTEKICQLWY